MSLLPKWLNGEKFDVLRDKVNALFDSYNGLASGTTGQALVKSSNADFGFSWITLSESIPSQAGHEDESLQTDGTDLFFGTPKYLTDGTYKKGFAIIPFGDWNMNTLSTIDIPHGLADFKKYLGSKFTIFNDAGTKVYDVPDKASGTGDSIGISYVDTNIIRFYRVDGGIYDSSAFQNTGYNRGYITIEFMV